MLFLKHHYFFLLLVVAVVALVPGRVSAQTNTYNIAVQFDAADGSTGCSEMEKRYMRTAVEFCGAFTNGDTGVGWTKWKQIGERFEEDNGGADRRRLQDAVMTDELEEDEDELLLLESLEEDDDETDTSDSDLDNSSSSSSSFFEELFPSNQNQRRLCSCYDFCQYGMGGYCECCSCCGSYRRRGLTQQLRARNVQELQVSVDSMKQCVEGWLSGNGYGHLVPCVKPEVNVRVEDC